MTDFSAGLRLSTCLLLWVVAIFLPGGCRRSLPQPSSPKYRDFVAAFYTGLAALQVGDDVRAERELARSTELVPGEASGWANWGILRLRQRDFAAATERLEKARKLSPENGQLLYLLALVESGKGDPTQAIADLRQAIRLAPDNLLATYQLAQEIERQGDANSDVEFESLLERIVAAQPANTAALLELGRVAAKRGDAESLKRVVAALREQSAAWPVEVQQQFAALETAAAGSDPRSAALRTTFLRNVLMRVPEFRQSLAAIKAQPGEEAQPFTHFLQLVTPGFTPAPADMALHFEVQPVPETSGGKWSWVGAIALDNSGEQVIAKANGNEVQLASGASFTFPGGPSQVGPAVEGVVPIDFNYDFKTDLVLAGAGGLRFLRQESPRAFTDVTAQTKLPPAAVHGHYTGAWAVDIEADGDLDVIVGSASGTPMVLRNNGDGSFSSQSPFHNISGVRQFVWADFNADGNPDAALIDGEGRLHVFENERLGHFRETVLPPGLGVVKAIAAADASHNGVLNLIAVTAEGKIVRLAEQPSGLTQWASDEIARVPDAGRALAGETRLTTADIDNNGAIDLVLAQAGVPGDQAAGALVWLGDAEGKFALSGSAAGPAAVLGIADVNGDGRLDLLGITADGQFSRGLNRGSKDYHWQVIRPRAKQAVGDQRINSFGVGGEIEIRSGLLVQLQPITGPMVHFGLGDQDRTDVARILWPNGSLRAEFALKADQQVVTEQRLKGSCPFLFAFNGKAMEFVKDAVPWGSAIGLRINNLGSASIAATEEWYKIGRDELAARNGRYDLRITGELWETYYYDYLGLMTVDHPAGTEIYTDERFVVPAVTPRIVVVSTPQPIVSAKDDQGEDVTATVRSLDGRYLDNFGRGQYQGVTRDHYVEVDLGENFPTGGVPVYLIAKGWLHPSDSSVNVAISQGAHEQGSPLRLEVPDGKGSWVVARANLGFPAGRKKICLIDLSGVFRPGQPHRLRLRTNLEIYWDSLEWATGRPDVAIKVHRLAPARADLHYRGYSMVQQANQSSPETPQYSRLASTQQTWRDLEGYYTRFGDVRDLLQSVDDRYVIMNAGDEMSFEFPAPSAPPAGWLRDFIIAGDGWIKDGDYNSVDSRNVLPLPHHDRKTYDVPPGKLEDEWVYQKFPQDWQTYQTRYVTPDKFNNALRVRGAQ